MNQFGKLKDFILNKNTLEIIFENQSGFIDFINDKLIRFYEKRVRKSQIVKDLREDIVVNISKVDGALQIITSQNIIIVKDDFMTTIYNKDMEEILCDTVHVQLEEQKGNKELLQLEGHTVSDEKSTEKLITKKMHDDEVFFGLGEESGFLNKRGYGYTMWNTDDPSTHIDFYKSLYKSIPFFIGKHSKFVYGIYLDNTYKTNFIMGKYDPNCFSFGYEGGNLDYYYMGGSSIKDIVETYTKLTGRHGLPQLWTLGNQQSRWSYMSKEEVMTVVNNYQKLQIPLDVIHLDIDYMEDYKVFTTSNDRFPNFKEFTKELALKGIKVVTIIDPGVKALKGYHVYDEGIENNFFATHNNEIYHNAVWPGDSVFPAFSSQRVRNWWSQKAYGLAELGVSGIWNDMNEPASFNGPLPDDVMFAGDDGEYTHAEVHNLYAHYMALATYEGLKKTGKRPYIISRAAFSGTNQYSTFWTGDNQSVWAHLQMAIPQMCNMGLSGLAFVGTDIGGFGADTTKELLIRWVQVGAFSPLCRNHSALHTKYQEPWRFDQETIDIYKKYIDIRYELVDYIYDLFYEHLQKGYPVLRPLVFEFEDDEKTFNLNDEFMVGEFILVAPVVMQGQTKKMVYLPRGGWYDSETKEFFESGYHIVDAPLNKCPIFYKAGSIICKRPKKQNLDGKPEVLILEVLPGEGKIMHYEDDGVSFAYEEGKYNQYEIQNKDGSLTLDLVHEGFVSTYKEVEIRYLDKVVRIPFEKNFKVVL